MNYIVDDRELDTADFLALANQVWPGDYDPAQTRQALEKTLNITAYDGGRLTGCLRILTDGYYFGTITELLVLPEYQHQGIGSRLLELARENSPPALLWRTARCGSILREKRMPKRDAGVYHSQGKITRLCVFLPRQPGKRYMALLFPVVSGQTSSPLRNNFESAKRNRHGRYDHAGFYIFGLPEDEV